jgi:predicted house-cleaning noncanonical NTP pyrophosphatase (MazG superfamily)
VVATDVFQEWKRSSAVDRTSLLLKLGRDIAEVTSEWASGYPRGIILRSSAVLESLRERGLLDSHALAADFSAEAIADAAQKIFQSAEDKLGGASVAIVLQPLVPGLLGHLSNEKRVSKTRNQWMWEQEGGAHYSGRFNSQRSEPPNKEQELVVDDDEDLIGCFRAIGRWCTQLEKGRIHLEWSWSRNRLWLLQLDLEDDAVDDGIDPRELIRSADGIPSEPCNDEGPLRECDFDASSTGWAKLDKLKKLAAAREDPFPRLYWVDGKSIRATGFDWDKLQTEIDRVTHGRAVCRTDCNSGHIQKLNLPRTDSVSAATAVAFVRDALKMLEEKGAAPESVCFVLHKFIPAESAAWAVATPASQIVKVDSLWGVPDGLQYLPHDSFEFDVKRGRISTERLRYKPAYIQEMQDGTWQEVKVSRRYARNRSLRQANLLEVASVTKSISDAADMPVQVMWFCGIPLSLGIGSNLPWFMMPPLSIKKEKVGRISPQRPRVVIRNVGDVDVLAAHPKPGVVLVLEPEVDLIRKDDNFLSRIIDYASANGIPVELHGSTLGHANYQLERAGLTLILSDEPRYSRTRGRRVFGKLVRDAIPAKIQRHGEQVRLAKIGRSEARAALLVKIMEEVQELKAASSPDDVTAELADLHEVVKALCEATGTDWPEVERIAEEKRKQRGSFRENVVLLETSWPSAMPREKSEPRQIPLKALASVKREGNAFQLSYATLFAQDADPTIELTNGIKVKVTLNENGLRLEEVKSQDEASEQFVFFF